MREYSAWLQVIICTDLRMRKRKNCSKILSRRERKPPRRGLPLRTEQRDGTIWGPTAVEGESVLEFVTVGGGFKASRCFVVKGGGNYAIRKLVRKCLDDRQILW